MNKRFLIIALILALFLMPLASAACSVSFDKTIYTPTEIITVEMSCSLNNEISESYTFNWTYANGTLLETDTGTTPATKTERFYETYQIPTGYSGFINASLVGANLEGSDFANVSSAGTSSLVITNVSIGGLWMGQSSSVNAIVTDENSKRISGGMCKYSLWSNDETSMLYTDEGPIFSGESKFNEIIDVAHMKEGTDYAVKLICYCGSTGSATECIDEDGSAVQNSIGTAKNVFTTNTWLVTTTSTYLSSMNLKQRNTVSVNVTNNRGDMRVPLEITFDCRIDRDDNYTRRIRSPFYFPECGTYGECTITRGISANTTQEQGIEMIVEEHPFLQGRNTIAYCSSYVKPVAVLIGELTYSTTSSAFNITSDEMNLIPGWQWVSDTRLTSIVNLSSSIFDDFNGTGVGNIDIRLSMFSAIDIKNSIEIFNLISNITVKNTTTTLTKDTHYRLEFLEDGNVEIELVNVNLSKLNESTWWNISLDFYDNNLRQTLALEGIENKTGTFHLDVDCPSQATIGSDMVCEITGQVEDLQLVQKEVDFTCYITDNLVNYSSSNFNQMINLTSQTFQRTFAVPSKFISGSSYVLQCHADYYNFGSRRDSFYDTFVASTSVASSSSGGGGSSGLEITGDAVIGLPDYKDDKDKKTPSPIDFKNKWVKTLIFFILILVVLIAIILTLDHKKRKANPYHHKKPNRFWKFILILIWAFLFISLIFYLGNLLSQASIQAGINSLLKDSLMRGIVLTIFIAGMIIILFKALNIKLDMKIGYPREERFRSNNRLSKLQDKINQTILEQELRELRNKKKN